MDIQFIFTMAHTHGALYIERGHLTSAEKEIKKRSSLLPKRNRTKQQTWLSGRRTRTSGASQVSVTLTEPELLQTPVYKETKKTKSQQPKEKMSKRTQTVGILARQKTLLPVITERQTPPSYLS